MKIKQRIKAFIYRSGASERFHGKAAGAKPSAPEKDRVH
jgi:hypothetical protein